jgi:hypothetical protein
VIIVRSFLRPAGRVFEFDSGGVEFGQRVVQVAFGVERLAVDEQLVEQADLAGLPRLGGELLVVGRRGDHRALQPRHALALAVEAAPQATHLGLASRVAAARSISACVASLMAWPMAASLRLKSGSGTESVSVVTRSRPSAGPSRPTFSPTVTSG